MIYLQESGQFLRFQRKVQIILAIVWGILADFCVPHERDNWNVQNMLDLWFSEASQNLSSFIHFHCFIGGLCTLWTCVKLKTSNSFSGVLQRTCMLFAVAQRQKRLWSLKPKIQGKCSYQVITIAKTEKAQLWKNQKRKISASLRAYDSACVSKFHPSIKDTIFQ